LVFELRQQEEIEMATRIKAFDAAKYLDTAEDHAELLSDALGTIARAHGMSRLAEETGLNRATLYAALKEDGNPTLDTVMKVANAVGISLHARELTHA
jgi:probable addiction module antidote protein